MKPNAKLMLVAMLLFWAYRAHATTTTVTCNMTEVSSCQSSAQRTFGTCMNSCVENNSCNGGNCHLYEVVVNNVESCTGSGPTDETCTEYVSTTTTTVPSQCLTQCIQPFENSMDSCISSDCH
jgi:hypothetical protein